MKSKKLFFNFLLKSKGDKIKGDIIISDYENGGLNMTDIKLFTKALKSSWAMVNGNSSLIWNYKISVTVLLLEAILVRRMYWKTSKNPIISLKKYYKFGQKLIM